jgi:putative transposase
VWARVTRDLGNIVACGVDQVAATVEALPKRVQYRPELIDDFLAQTGLTLDPQQP